MQLREDSKSMSGFRKQFIKKKQLRRHKRPYNAQNNHINNNPNNTQTNKSNKTLTDSCDSLNNSNNNLQIINNKFNINTCIKSATLEKQNNSIGTF